MFWFLIYLSIAAAVVTGVVGQIKENASLKQDKRWDAQGAWFGWGLAGLLGGLLVTVILSALVGFVTWASHLGSERVIGSTTYKVAENSRIETYYTDLEFTYVDETGHLKEYDGWVNSVKFEGTKYKTVEIIDVQIVAENILPWEIINERKLAVVK